MAANKRYFGKGRIIALIVWLVLLILIPWSMMFFKIMPAGTWFVPAILVFVCVLAVFFNKLSLYVGVGVSVFLAIFSLYKPDFVSDVLDGLNDRLQDAFFQLRGPKKNTKQIVIVDIDQNSLEKVGQWPWPRVDVADVIRNIQADGAKVIGFDIVFAEPGRFSLKDWASRLQSIGIEMELPGASSEVSFEAINKEKWSLHVPGTVLKNIVLNVWQRHFEEVLPEFFVDNTNSKEREKAIIEEFLAADKKQWDEEQNKQKERAISFGKGYMVQPYRQPKNPLLAMGRQSGELFYMDTDWKDPKIFETGVSVVINNDEDLADACQKCTVVVGGFFILESNIGSRKVILKFKEGSEETEGMILNAFIKDSDEVFPGLRQAEDQVLNIPVIQSKANYQGTFNVVPDRSGAARDYTMILRGPIYERTLVLKEDKAGVTGLDFLDPNNYEEKIITHYLTYPSIALSMLFVANDYNRIDAVDFVSGQKGLLLYHKDARDDDKDRMFIPLDFKGDVRINYLSFGGPWKAGDVYGSDYFFKYVSMADVLYNTFEPGTFKDKYVLIGSTDPTLSDLVGSPFKAAFPGLEVHATMLENLLSQDYLINLEYKQTWYVFLGLAVGGALLSLVVAYAISWVSGIIILALLVGLPVFNYWQFAELNIAVEFFYPWICIGIIGSVVILVNFFVEGREKRFLNATFKHYLSPDLIEQMISSGTQPRLGGQEGLLTAYFTDIAGFSTISEVLGSPVRLVELLNEYLTGMTDILLEHDGTLDKYEGDAIIAFFGAPMPLENHALSACRSAVAMQRKLGELREKWMSEGDRWPKIVHEMRMRIGINSGMLVTGNMGSALRMNYTMMGDAVNLAARLESGSKQYGVFVLCSQDTMNLVEGAFVARSIDIIRVVGKSEPVEIFEIIVEKDDANETLISLVEKFSAARQAYLKMDWDQAIALFEECLPLEPHHPDRAPGCKTTPSHVFIERCHQYKQTPPVTEDGAWDGVYTATEK